MTVSVQNVISVDRSDDHSVGGFSAFKLESSGKEISFSELISRMDVTLYCYDLAAQQLLFVKIDDMQALSSEPFLDRAVRNHAADEAFTCSFATATAWTEALPEERSSELKLCWIWNTGRCGSTLMHRLLAATGAVCSRSEPYWLDDLCHQVGDGAVVGTEALALVKMMFLVDVSGAMLVRSASCVPCRPPH